MFETHRPISRYDEIVARYVISNFPDCRVLDVGMGIGTLDAVLACQGYRVGGLERASTRVRSARKLRQELIKTWPVVSECYEIIEGSFPEIIKGSAWEAKDVVLVFTITSPGWDDDLTNRAIDSMPSFGHVIVDLLRFGVRRETEAEREDLFQRIGGIAKSAQWIPQNITGSYYLARFDF